MLRKASLDNEKLRDEARFILKNLQRNDLFGDRVQMSEAERILQSALSLSFQEFISFLTKYGYVRLDSDGQVLTVTRGGRMVVDSEDAEFFSRLARHFAREVNGGSRPKPIDTTSSVIPNYTEAVSSVPRTRRPLSVDALEEGEVLDRRYQRGAAIGRGAIGVVYQGRHVGLGRQIAIKEAQTIFQYASYLRRDEIVQRLRMAVETHAQLEHPHIIQILDQNDEREHPYFVMELAQGGNLRQRLTASEQDPPSLPTAVRVLTQVVYALQYAHNLGVVHRGLKPENILFDHLGNVKMTDFGMASILDQPEDIGPAPLLVGGNTVAYFAPERLQVDVVSTPGEAADIYALGILFYEMLTGKIPGRRSPLPSEVRDDVPVAFDEVFDRMTRDSLSERYANMSEVLDGVYQAFGRELLFESGSILAWAKDPGPVPSVPLQLTAPGVPIADELLDMSGSQVDSLNSGPMTLDIGRGMASLTSVAIVESASDVAKDLPIDVRSVSRQALPPPPPVDN
ncbi:MAG: serine/threonine protein kinase [Myxococcales bacterium]|nr:serine/threonine protein kinase [Myxococcales bacterium]